jgi:hypothetical protein
MNTKSALNIKFNALPPKLQEEALHYIEFLLTKTQVKHEEKQKRKCGFAKGTYIMSEDFDEPLEDLKEYM